ncbi:hypothetical protein F4861DRAFT_536434 [Xylaria intraflava]|nr:hypothetical protein F4861DRAFT_536434 [Xylaria intraflava]
MSDPVSPAIGDVVEVAPAMPFYGNPQLAACLYSRLRRDQPTREHPDIRTSPERNAYLTMHYCYGLAPMEHPHIFSTLVSILDPGITTRSKRRKAGITSGKTLCSPNIARIYMDMEVNRLQGSADAAHNTTVLRDRRRKRGSQSSDGSPASRPPRKKLSAALSMASVNYPSSEEAREPDDAMEIHQDQSEAPQSKKLSLGETEHLGANAAEFIRGSLMNSLRPEESYAVGAPEFIDKEKKRMTEAEVISYWSEKLKEYFGETSNEFQQYQSACRQ